MDLSFGVPVPWGNCNPWYDLLPCTLCNTCITLLFESIHASYLVPVFLEQQETMVAFAMEPRDMATKTYRYNCGIWRHMSFIFGLTVL